MMSIEQYIKQLKANNRAERTIISYRYILEKLEEYKPLDTITKDDLVEFFIDFKGTDQTKKLYQGVIKKFFKDAGKPELVTWISSVKVKITNKEVLTVEDINTLIDGTTSPLWKAWISFAFESGARYSEIASLKWSDFKDGVVVITTHKTGAGLRRIPIPMSWNYIKNLRMNVKANDSDIVFPRTETAVLKMMDRIASGVGLKKKVNPHAFRHARATDLVLRGTQEASIRLQLGWSPTSTMIARYQHLTDQTLVNAEYGEDIPELPDIKPAPNQEGDIEVLKQRIRELEAKLTILPSAELMKKILELTK